MRDSSGFGDHKVGTTPALLDHCPDPVELVLYVSAESPGPAHAIRNIKRALSRYRSDRVTLTICDPAKDLALVKRSAGPRTFILGHITNSELLIELLDGCDIES